MQILIEIFIGISLAALAVGVVNFICLLKAEKQLHELEIKHEILFKVFDEYARIKDKEKQWTK